MRTFAFSLFVLFFLGFQSHAQGLGDVLRLSQYTYTGSARATAMGGAFGSLGADVSSMSLNPAGMGMYRTSEMIFTAGLGYVRGKSVFDNGHGSDERMQLFANNISYVATSLRDNSPWESFSVGIGYNRLADFNRDLAFYTPSGSTSLLDEFVNFSNLGMGSEAYEVLAINTHLLRYSSSLEPEPYYSDFTMEGTYGQEVIRSLKVRGGIGEYAVSVGANWMSTLYLGATLGIQDVEYKETMDHKEWAPGSFEYLEGFWFTDYFKITGWGLNLKAGAVYRPIPSLRLGLAVHTPTWYDLDATQETYMDAYYKKDPAIGGEDEPVVYSDDYVIEGYGFKIRSPFRYIGSASFQFGEIGLLSVDYEWVDYGNADFKMSADPGFEMDIRNQITTLARSAGNLRVGGEIRAGITSFRAGYAYYGSPDADNYFRNLKLQTYSAGLGWRFSDFYLDVAYVYTAQKENVRMYETASAYLVSPVKTNASRLYATLGFKF